MAGTAGKYHINAKGEPEKCTATVRPCPYGGTGHYDTPGEAKTAMEKMWKEKVLEKSGGQATTLTKKNNALGKKEPTDGHEPTEDKKQLAKDAIAERDEALDLIEKVDSRYGNDNGKLTASLNASFNRNSSGPRDLLVKLNNAQLKAADLIGNESEKNYKRPSELLYKTSDKDEYDRLEKQIADRESLNETFSSKDSIVDEPNGIEMADIYNRGIGDDYDDYSKIGIAPVQTMNWNVGEDNYDVYVTVTDNDLKKAGVDAASLGEDSVDLRDPVLYKNAWNIQRYITGQNSDGYGEDLSYYDGQRDHEVVMDWTPKLTSISRTAHRNDFEGHEPGWVIRFHGNTEIDPGYDPFEDDEYEDDDDENDDFD